MRVIVRREEGKILLEILDNGRGFDANIDHEALRLEGHRGLANMKERMALIGGTLTITSEPGKGTRVLAALPLPRPSMV